MMQSIHFLKVCIGLLKFVIEYIMPQNLFRLISNMGFIGIIFS